MDMPETHKETLGAYKGGFISIGKLAGIMGMHVLELRNWLTELLPVIESDKGLLYPSAGTTTGKSILSRSFLLHRIPPAQSISTEDITLTSLISSLDEEFHLISPSTGNK